MNRTPPDLLSALLRNVRLESADYFPVELSAPWVLCSGGHWVRPGRQLREVGPSSAGPSAVSHVMALHYVVEGSAVVLCQDGSDTPLKGGDLVVFPNEVGQDITSLDHARAPVPAEYRAEGPTTRLVSAYLICRPPSASAALSALPPCLRVSLGSGVADDWLRSSLVFAASPSADRGRSVVVTRLSEVLLFEAVRRALEHLATPATGWLAASRDEVLGTVLSAIHSRPELPWDLALLAAEAGTSRSQLGRRCSEVLGEGAMGYLRRWRLVTAARTLETTDVTMGDVAWRAGFRSEAGFGRAFRALFGVAPGLYRQRHGQPLHASPRPWAWARQGGSPWTP